MMSNTALSPKFSRTRKDLGNQPAVYKGKGQPPLRFDDEQGWEVATDQGRRLNLAITNVGSAIEARAESLRQPPSLSLEQIASMNQALSQAERDVLGSDFRNLGKQGREARRYLSEALNLHAPSTVFYSQAEYEACVNATLALASQLSSQPQRLIEALKREQSHFAPDVEFQSAWAMHQARIDSQTRLRVLAETRPMGGRYSEKFTKEETVVWKFRKSVTPISRGGRLAKRLVDSTARVLPRDWVNRTGKGSLRVEMGESTRNESGNITHIESSRWVPSPSQGGALAPGVRFSSLPQPHQGPMSGRESDALHEMGHHLEFIYPEINQIARTHKALRTTGPDGRLDEIECLTPSLKDELPPQPERMNTTNDYSGWGRPDSFAATYAGQETGPRASEVFSTGLEAAIGGRYGALRGHGGVKADPEHLHLVLGILATVGRC